MFDFEDQNTTPWYPTDLKTIDDLLTETLSQNDDENELYLTSTNFDSYSNSDDSNNFSGGNTNFLFVNDNYSESYNQTDVICDGQSMVPAVNFNNNQIGTTTIFVDQNETTTGTKNCNQILSDYGTDKEEVAVNQSDTHTFSSENKNTNMNFQYQIPFGQNFPVIENNFTQNMHPLNNLLNGNYFGIANFNVQNNFGSDFLVPQPEISVSKKRKISEDSNQNEIEKQPEKKIKKLGRPKKGEEKPKNSTKKSYYVKKIKPPPKSQQEIKAERKDLNHIPDKISNSGQKMDKTELRHFANQVKKARVRLGFTQADVGISLGALFNKNFSQTTICRFESLQLSYKNLTNLTPVLQDWLTLSFTDPNKVVHFTQLAQDEINKRRNYELNESAVECLENQWKRNGGKSPSYHVMANLAHSVGVDKEVIKKWFNGRENQEK